MPPGPQRGTQRHTGWKNRGHLFSFCSLLPSPKWVRASARNCGRRIAECSACPTRGWVKSVSLGMRVTVPQVLSLRGRQYLGVILPFLLSSVSGAGGGRLFGQTSSTMAGTAAQTDPKPPGIPTPPASGAHRGSQAVTWGFSAPPGGWSSAGAPWTVLIIPDDVSSRQMCAGSFEKAGATLPPF